MTFAARCASPAHHQPPRSNGADAPAAGGRRRAGAGGRGRGRSRPPAHAAPRPLRWLSSPRDPSASSRVRAVSRGVKCVCCTVTCRGAAAGRRPREYELAPAPAAAPASPLNSARDPQPSHKVSSCCASYPAAPLTGCTLSAGTLGASARRLRCIVSIINCPNSRLAQWARRARHWSLRLARL